MNSLEDSILRTMLYADIFDFPMTLAEIQHFLITTAPTTTLEVERTLMASERLRQLVTCIDGYYMLSGREELAGVRAMRERASQRLWGEAELYARWLGRVPFVQMVALTGALAMRNALDEDDIDYVLVTRNGRVWMARGFAIIIVRLARARGIQLCPNYVLAESALAQDQQNIYMAHEIAQMVPMVGFEWYTLMRAENRWVFGHLPNAAGPFALGRQQTNGWLWRLLRRAMEGVLNGALGDMLEAWERERKLRRFAPRTQGSHGAVLDAERVKGHFQDHGHPALMRFHERLRQFEIEPLE